MGRIYGDLLDRTFEFAVQILELAPELPNEPRGWVVGKQVIRSGTSVGSNVREADHALTTAEFAHKCNLSRKEAAETKYWLDLCARSGLLRPDRIAALSNEAEELVKVLGAIVKKCQEG